MKFIKQTKYCKKVSRPLSFRSFKPVLFVALLFQGMMMMMMMILLLLLLLPSSSNGQRGAPSWGVKRPGREADHSPPPSSEIGNTWRYTSTLIRLHVVVLS